MTDTPSDDAADDQAEADQDAEALIDAAAQDAQQRLWLRAIIEILKQRSGERDHSDRVAFAEDQLMVAAYERAARILRSDLGPACP
jgi:hypothetical protein